MTTIENNSHFAAKESASSLALSSEEEKIEKLRLVFRAMTAHMENWKNSFSVFCGQADLELYSEAIAFHVGEYPTATLLPAKHYAAPRYKVSSRGYYQVCGA